MFYAIVALIAMILDQMLKYWTGTTIPLNATDGPVIIPGLIRLTNLHNTGAAFSLLAGGKFTWFFVVLCVVFVGGVVYALRKGVIRTEPARWAAIMVMAGAVGNCADRIINTTPDAAGFSHYVVDMIELIPFSFPVFNLADIYITVGAICFCIFTLLEKGEEEFEKEAEETPGAFSWNIRRTYAGRPVRPTAPAPESQPDRDGLAETAAQKSWEPEVEPPRVKEFREWKVMEGPAAPPMDREESEPEGGKEGLAQEENPAKIVYSQPKRSPGGDAAFSRTEAAVRSVQAAARPPEAAEPATKEGAPEEVPEPAYTPDAAPAGEDAPAKELPKPAAQLFSKTEQVVRTLVRGNPPSPPPPSRSAEGTSTHSTEDLSTLENESYDLDDILAEFRDT